MLEQLSQFESRGIRRHGVLLLPQLAALEFLDASRGTIDQLLGFDAFRIVDENRIQPLLEFTLDLSDSAHQQLTHGQKYIVARKVLQAASPETHFEFVFGG